MRVLVVGNQKSGTTVLAKCVAFKLGMDCVVDPLARSPWPPENPEAELVLEKGNVVVKDPDATFLLDSVSEHFDLTFSVIRDPRANVRSILDRAGLPGHMEKLCSLRRESDLTPAAADAWERVFDPKTIGERARAHYVENLAARWSAAAREAASDEMDGVLRYERFNREPEAELFRVLGQLKRFRHQPASQVYEVQHQDPGANRGVSWNEFFGEANLKRLERTCKQEMKLHNYKPIWI